MVFLMNMRHLLRMSRWARNPPSEKKVIMVFAIIAFCLILFGIEYAGFWPDWAKTNSLKP
ncbi:hypothetical protein DS909_14510 [Phaeobacter gallaeciensis]|uniref:Lipoyl synthase n=2 Tax=Roseobacteraceae TaxID=2854170 RepID=A0A366WXD9_9RHOB|nr:hypothetical protein DS909_14510 [Phaeobacter gallaeciensis]